MVNADVALGLLQLVALSLPAFAILLELMVESDFPYANWSVAVISAGFILFVAAGMIVVTSFVFERFSRPLTVAFAVVDVGLLALAVGIGLIAVRTRRAQQQGYD